MEDARVIRDGAVHGGAPVRANLEGHEGPRGEAYCRRGTINPQGGGLRNGCIDRQDGSLVGVLSLCGNTHAARSLGNKGEHFALHSSYPSGSPAPARNFTESSRTRTGTRTKWAVRAGERRTDEMEVFENWWLRGLDSVTI